MDDVLIGAWHGGLGDSLQFSTLPEEFYKQQGRETYVADGCSFRNKEIYDLVWGCNPYVKGVKEGERNAGDIPDIQFASLVASGGGLSHCSRVQCHHAYRVPATRAPNSPYLSTVLTTRGR